MTGRARTSIVGTSVRSRTLTAAVCLLTLTSALAQNNNDWYFRQQQMQQMQRQQAEMRRQQELERQRAMERERMLQQQRERMRAEQQRMQAQQRERMLAEQRQRQQAEQQRARQEQERRQRELAQSQRAQADRNRQQQGLRSQSQNKNMAKGTGVAPGSNRLVLANGRLTRPLTPGEIQRGFTGRVTPDGRALVKVQNRIFTVPASRIAGLSARLARLRASTSLSTSKQNSMRELAQKLAQRTKPAAVASRIDAARAARNAPRLTNLKLVDDKKLAAKQAALKTPLPPGTSTTARRQAGVANYNGKLVHVTNPNWLAGRNSLPVPGQVAQRLQGRQFKSFDEFRKTFWKEVAKDPVLRESFGKAHIDNIDRMRGGKAPYTVSAQQRGSRAVYELDHHHELQDGGGAYDLNNIRIKTPDAHMRKISRDFNLSSGAH